MNNTSLIPLIASLSFLGAGLGAGFLEVYMYPGFWPAHIGVSLIVIVIVTGIISLALAKWYSFLSGNRWLLYLQFITLGTTYLIYLLLARLNIILIRETQSIPEILYLTMHLDVRVIRSLFPATIFLWFVSGLLVWQTWISFLLLLFVKLSDLISWIRSDRGKLIIRQLFSWWDVAFFLFSLAIFLSIQTIYDLPLISNELIQSLFAYSVIGAVIQPSVKSSITINGAMIILAASTFLSISQFMNPLLTLVLTVVSAVGLLAVNALNKKPPLSNSQGRNNTSVISISLDLNILKQRYADAQERQKEYAKHFNHFVVIVLSSKDEHQRHSIPTEYHHQNLHVYATASVIKPLAIIGAIRLAYTLHKLYSFEVVSSQDPLATGLTAFFLKHTLNIPFNLQLHSTYMFAPGWVIQSIRNILLTPLVFWMVNQADSIRSVNKQVAALIQQKHHHIVVNAIPIRVPVDFFFKKAVFKKHRRRFITVGRLSPEKNQRMLITAFSRVYREHPDIELVIAGGGILEQELKQQVKQLGLEGKVSFPGLVSKEQVRSLLHIGDIFVLPSNYEGWALVFAEAFAAGLPIISTQVGSQDDIIRKDINAKVVPVKKAKRLEEAMIWMIEHPKEAYQYAQKGQQGIMEQYNPQSLTQKWVELLQRTDRKQ